MAAVVDVALCRACGQCVRVCPSRVLESDPETRRPAGVAGFDDLCIACGQCMMVCEPQAIQIGVLDYARDFHEYAGAPADAASFRALLERRRSVRRFAPRAVERDLLRELADLGSLAPMGFPPHKVQLTILDDRPRIAAGVPLIRQFYNQFLKLVGNPLVAWLFRQSVSRGDWALLSGHVQPLLQHIRRQTGPDFDYITMEAPAVILVHAHRDAPDHVADAGIVLTYVMLAAHALGLGATVIGLIPPAVGRLPALRRLWGLGDDQHVVGAVVVGHPAVRYQRAVRRELQVHWPGPPAASVGSAV